jgi:hypothetical protein
MARTEVVSDDPPGDRRDACGEIHSRSLNEVDGLGRRIVAPGGARAIHPLLILLSPNFYILCV